MKGVLRDLLRGTGLALVTGAGSFLLARYGLGHLFYLSVLLPAAMVALLLIAWVIHLRADGFFGSPAQEPASQAVPESRRAGAERFYAAFDEGLLERSVPRGQREAAWQASDLVHALLWASAVLGLASIALYHWAGIGSRLLR